MRKALNNSTHMAIYATYQTQTARDTDTYFPYKNIYVKYLSIWHKYEYVKF